MSDEAAEVSAVQQAVEMENGGYEETDEAPLFDLPRALDEDPSAGGRARACDGSLPDAPRAARVAPDPPPPTLPGARRSART